MILYKDKESFSATTSSKLYGPLTVCYSIRFSVSYSAHVPHRTTTYPPLFCYFFRHVASALHIQMIQIYCGLHFKRLFIYYRVHSEQPLHSSSQCWLCRGCEYSKRSHSSSLYFLSHCSKLNTFKLGQKTMWWTEVGPILSYQRWPYFRNGHFNKPCSFLRS